MTRAGLAMSLLLSLGWVMACDSDEEVIEVCCGCFELGQPCPSEAEALQCDSEVVWCRRVYTDPQRFQGCVDGTWQEVSLTQGTPVNFDPTTADTCTADLGDDWVCNEGSGLCEKAPPAEPIAMIVRVINPATGAGYSGVTAEFDGQSVTTDSLGQATIEVLPGPFQVTLSASDARDHHVFGQAGSEPFTQITYMSPDAVTQGVFGALGLSVDAERGILVVGLDTPTLAPAVGASAVIDVLSGEPFIVAGIAPQFGHTITDGAQGFVSFPNVEPGLVTVSAEMPSGGCAVFPAESGLPDVTVFAGEVSIIAFTCRVP